jgi:replicative DNA helicase
MTRNTSKNEKQLKTGLSESNTANYLPYGKTPPQARELEVAVLGAIMIERSVFDVVCGILRAECFYVDAHQTIFRAMHALQNKNTPIDILTVVEQLKFMEMLDFVGGPYFVTKLTNEVVSTANVETHARIVLQKFIARELIRLSLETLDNAFKESMDVFDLRDKHEAGFTAIVQNNMRGDYQDASTLVAGSIERLDSLRANEGMLTGVPTGYKPMNRVTNGWQPTDLIILAARPSVGKSAVAINFAMKAAEDIEKPTPVGIFSLEMSSGQLMNRIISAKAEVDLSKITRGKMENDEYVRITKAADKISVLGLYIDDTPGLSIVEFKSKARKMVREHKVGLIIIDYLQLMSGNNDRNNSREQDISDISRNLKMLAKELHIPIIALSQLSRQNEKEKREPRLSDLRESGAIEQDADDVIFITRPAYEKEDGQVDPLILNDISFHIKKHRHGPLDTIPMKVDLSIQKVFDLEQWKEYDKPVLTLGNQPTLNFTRKDDLPF